MAQLQHVEGLDGLLATLKSLPAEIVSKRGGPTRSSLRAAGVVFQKAYQENIRAIIAEPNKDGRSSRTTGTLEKSVVVSRGRADFQGELFLVRIRRGARAPNGQSVSKYAGILEFGYEGVPARAPMRRAFESGKNEAVGVFVEQMRRRLRSATRRARKRGLI